MERSYHRGHAVSMGMIYELKQRTGTHPAISIVTPDSVCCLGSLDAIEGCWLAFHCFKLLLPKPE
ncbi:hypothetical protein NDU88_005474, partial [Pleurodeles waltl]